MRNCWSVLGIQPTADKKEIKKAYAAKSREFHPAEHPVEYEELKKAYQEAIRLASQPEPEQRPVLNPIPEKDHGLEEFYDHLETEARSKFVPNAGQWNLDFHFASTQVLGETEQEQQQVFASIRSNQNLNWCQRSHMDLFLRQAFLFHQYNTFRADYWEALCEEIKERYRKEVGQYPDSKHSVFFPDPNVTEHLIGVLSQMPELDYRTWDVFEKYMLPPKSRRNKAEWAPVVDRFLAVRSFRQPGHSYPDYQRESVASLRKELFPWEQGISESNPEKQRDKKRSSRRIHAMLKVAILLLSLLYGAFARNSSHSSNSQSSSNQEIVNHAIEEYNQEYTQRLLDYQTNPWNLDMSKEPRLSLDYTFMYDGELYFLCYDNGKYYCEQGSGVEEGQRFAYSVEEFIELHPDAEEQVNALIEKRKANEASSQAPSEQPYMSGEEEENGD